MMVIMVAAAVVMQNVLSAITEVYTEGSKNMDVKCLILPGLSQGKLWLVSLGLWEVNAKKGLDIWEIIGEKVYEG